MLFTTESNAFTIIGIDERPATGPVYCAHCNKKLPKHPVLVQSSEVEAVVGADCILENVALFISAKLERDLAMPSETDPAERLEYLTGLHTRNFKSKIKDMIKENQKRLAVLND